MTGFFLWVLLRSDIGDINKWKQIATVPDHNMCTMLARGMNEDLTLHPTSPLMFICEGGMK